MFRDLFLAAFSLYLGNNNEHVIRYDPITKTVHHSITWQNDDAFIATGAGLSYFNKGVFFSTFVQCIAICCSHVIEDNL